MSGFGGGGGPTAAAAAASPNAQGASATTPDSAATTASSDVNGKGSTSVAADAVSVSGDGDGKGPASPVGGETSADGEKNKEKDTEKGQGENNELDDIKSMDLSKFVNGDQFFGQGIHLWAIVSALRDQNYTFARFAVLYASMLLLFAQLLMLNTVMLEAGRTRCSDHGQCITGAFCSPCIGSCLTGIFSGDTCMDCKYLPEYSELFTAELARVTSNVSTGILSAANLYSKDRL